MTDKLNKKVEITAYDYVNSYRRGMASIDYVELNRAAMVIVDAKLDNKCIYVGGNGGSAAISNHLCCDFSKGCKPLKAISVSCNTPLITAISNDLSYADSLSFQLESLMNKGDVCILISSSGNSPNIVKAAELVKEKECTLIGMTGFDGGQLQLKSDISLHIPVNNYGVVEDCHQSLMHIISQHIASLRIG